MFEAVVRHRSLRAAAHALGLHHATLSRRVERLEDRLGARVLERRQGGISVTPAGEVLSHAAADFAERLVEVRRRVSGTDRALRGTVTLTAPATIAEACLAPRMRGFAERYPEMDLRIKVTYATLDLARGEADVAIRVSDAPLDTLVGKRVLTLHQGAYATPAYFARIARGEETPRWICWSRGPAFRRAVARTPWPDAPLWGEFEDVTTQVALAREGVGLAFLPAFCGEREPRLARAPGTKLQKGSDVWVLTHPDLRNTARIRAAMAFAETALRADKALFTGADTRADTRAD